MPQQPDPFHAFLDEFNIPYDPPSGRLGTRVRGNLVLSESGVLDLPDHLVVEGALDLTGTGITCLPKHLTVQDDLYIQGTRISVIPPDLFVAQDLWMEDSGITVLPDNFRVGGTLGLSDTKVTALPEGLHVEGYLNLDDTDITRLPTNMFVGKAITPPAGLLDMVAFMDQHTNARVIIQHASHHEILARQAQLRAFPDLCRVVAALGLGHRLCIKRTRQGELHVDLQWAS